MPTVYRIEKRRHAAQALAGIGGLFAAGRWHRKGVRVSYASEHHAVAAMEKLVWLGSLEDALAGDYVVLPLDVPDTLVEVLPLAELPLEWNTYPHGSATQEIGMRWLLDLRSAALQVPSAVVPHAFNLLLNPAHPQALRLEAGALAPFAWDPRLF